MAHSLADDPSSPYYLHPSDNPGALIVAEQFSGENYASWSRAILMALSVKNKNWFIDGSVSPPTDTTSTVYLAWVRVNNLVLSWLLNAVCKDIRQSLLYFSVAQDVWDELKTRYVLSSGPRVFQLQKLLSTMTQGSLSITSYYNNFKMYL